MVFAGARFLSYDQTGDSGEGSLNSTFFNYLRLEGTKEFDTWKGAIAF